MARIKTNFDEERETTDRLAAKYRTISLCSALDYGLTIVPGAPRTLTIVNFLDR